MLNIIKMTSLKDFEKKFKDLSLKIGEVKALKKQFNIEGRWTKEKYINFFGKIKNQTSLSYRELLQKAKQLGYNNKRSTKLQLESFITDREKKNRRNEKDRQRRAEKTTNKLIIDDKFQKIFDRFVKKGILLTEIQINKLLNKLLNKRYIITIKIDDEIQHIPINQNTISFLSSIFQNGLIKTEEQFGSDILDKLEIKNIKKLTLSQLSEPKRLLKNKNGSFFPYINTSNIDLSKYQIFNQNQAYDKKLIENREHCLFFTLLLAGIDIDVCNSIKLSYVTDHKHISKKDLKNIASKIRRDIILYTINDNINAKKLVQQQKITALFTEKNAPIKIALYEEHYFLYEKSKYSEFFIKHYQELKDVENPNTIRQIKHIKGKSYFERKDDLERIDSLLLVYNLKLQNCFEKLDFSYFVENTINSQTKHHIYLDNIKQEQRPYMLKDEYEPKPKKGDLLGNLLGVAEPEIFYADCESFVYKNPHRLYLLGVVSNKSDIVVTLNDCNYSHTQQLIYDFLNLVSNNGRRNAIVYFHNLKYDLHLIEHYLNIIKKCIRDNQIYNVVISYKNIKIELRDSFKLIPIALKDFQKNFDLPKEYCKKEASAYKYYTPENNDIRIHINKYMDFLTDEEKIKFMDNMKDEPEFDIKTNTFNPLSYYLEYLRLDCLVLKKGLIKFDEMIKGITGLSIYKSLTISSLTDKYMTINGAYKNVYEVNGNLREYIAKAVYGGRVCVNEKYAKKVINGKISDYDGVSLYPSAIYRLCKEIGLPTGQAKRLNGQDWKKFKYSIITVQITKVNKKQQMPFIAHKGDGVINYSNEPPKEPIIIDNITLKDYIDFHEIEFNVIDGVYWEGEFNTKMGELINNLFQSRLLYKTSNPALADVFKLMLNSSYGKTIMKKANTEIKIIYTDDANDEDKFDRYGNLIEKPTNFAAYVYNNFNTIKSYRKISFFNTEFEHFCADNSFNRGHIGCAILSMSKRIMNEVFDIANTNEFPIYYTDTDSLHCNFDDVFKLEEKYKERYGKELNGKNLCQFHTDFKLNGAKSDIYATKSIFLGKKSYCDYLESKDEKGDIINGYHIRLKGITEAGILHSANEYKDGYFGLFEDLTKGDKKRILLNPPGKVLFEYKMGHVSTKTEFYREIKF